MIDETKLKPCPFCGGEAETSCGWSSGEGAWAFVRCTDCHAIIRETEDYVTSEVISETLQALCVEAWNRRVEEGK